MSAFGPYADEVIIDMTKLGERGIYLVLAKNAEEFARYFAVTNIEKLIKATAKTILFKLNKRILDPLTSFFIIAKRSF